MRSDILILIPARSGSLRIKNKNIKFLGNMPLVSHIIKSAIDSDSGRVVVSTDSEEIAKISRNFGAETPFLRPKELSTDTSPSLLVIFHALNWFKENENWLPGFTTFCPPTNPFTRAKTIKEMCEMLAINQKVNSIATVTKARTHPFRIVNILEDNTLQNGVISLKSKTINDVERTQEFPQAWEGSPACRVTKNKFFLGLASAQKNLQEINYNKTYDIHKCLAYVVGQIEAFDLDQEDDWLVAESLLKLFKKKR